MPILKTYSKFWSMETMLYHLEGWKLLIPLSPKVVSYYAIGELIVIVINKIPILNLIREVPYLGHPIVFFIVLPVGIMKLLSTVKIDGKLPYKYFADMFKFLVFTPRDYEYLQPLRRKRRVTQKLKKVAHVRITDTKSVFEETDSKATLIEIKN